MTDKKQRPTLRLVKSVAMNAIPGYPVYKALGSARHNIMGGVQTITDLMEQVEGQKRSRTVRTWSEAIATRPADALPLNVIATKCLVRKRAALSFLYICTVLWIGGLIAGNGITIFDGIIGSVLPALFLVREEHRLWQMETGPMRPDEPLGSIGAFLRTRGVVIRLLNPYLF